MRIVLAFTLVVFCTPAPAKAQTWSPLSTDVFSSIVSAGASVLETRREIEHGKGALSGGIALSRGGFDAGDLFVVFGVHGQTAAFRRTSVTDAAQVTAIFGRRLDDNGVIWIGAEGSVLPGADSHRATAALSGGLRIRVPKWLPERNPFLIIEAARDLARYDATYVRTALRLDYKFKPTMGLFIEGGHAWSGLPGDDNHGAIPFSAHGTDVTITLTKQTAPEHQKPDHAAMSLEPYVRMLWIRRGAERSHFDLGVRVTFVR